MSLSIKKRQRFQHEYPIEKLSYEIHSCSSYSTSYHPKNIMENKPSEQTSRWSCYNNGRQTQYVLLKLDKMAIYWENILKQFKVYGGLAPNNMIEILHNGLQNNPHAETFQLKYCTNNVVSKKLLPFQFIKIIPLAAYATNHSFSIWYVELKGVQDQEIVQKAYYDYLAHFRQKNYLNAFDALQSRTHILLEDPVLTDLYTQLVINGDFQLSEEIICEAVTNGLFEDYLHDKVPCMRGGHQMCIDAEVIIDWIQTLHCWNGTTNLSDFWVYNINKNSWSLISGPEPRSNHKMCFDPKYKKIYVYGKFISHEMRSIVNLNADFYQYNITTNQCGLYSYNIPTNEWKLIRSEYKLPNDQAQLRIRVGISMLFDPDENLLYIIGGGDCDNMFLSADSVYELSTEYMTRCDQDLIFIHRINIDLETKEIYVLVGLREKRDKRSYVIKNAFWVYDLLKDRWTKIYQSEIHDSYYWLSNETVEPRPRLAHQFIYDNLNKVHYLFGGRFVETEASMKQRLDDFWEFHLIRPKPENLLRGIKYFIRKQKYKELCFEGNSIAALKYLQVQLGQLVDQENESERVEFQALTSGLFNIKRDEIYNSFNDRMELYEILLEYFPDNMKQPKQNLIELIQVQ
ncbi:15779_t:CDS:10 [Entrophospora sp. SA101]|nr:15779_t:CDS:10 [Entrophospora sp. SA101]CAJ0927552.1 8612_t:CDS:10 [Entrophospora sp. SA101]